MSTLNGPRVSPTGSPAQLVVLCHGYGSDGNDLIGLAPHWRNYLPHAAFVAPNGAQRHPMGSGYQWFPLSRIDPDEALRGTEAAAPILDQFIDLRILSVDGRALECAWQKSGTNVRGFHPVRGESNESGQILIFAAQPVRNPRAHTWLD